MDHIQSTNGVNRIDFYKAIVLVEGQSKEFIIDTRSPITLFPPIFSPKKLTKTTKIFVDINKNPIKFKGDALVRVKTEKSKITLQLQGTRNTNIIRNKTKDEKSTKILNEFEDRFKNYLTIEGLTIDIQLKKDTKPIQQKGRPVPIRFQNSVRHELRNYLKRGTWRSQTERQKTALSHRLL